MNTSKLHKTNRDSSFLAFKKANFFNSPLGRRNQLRLILYLICPLHSPIKDTLKTGKQIEIVRSGK